MMKAHKIQRILLYAIVLPFATLTFAWYVMLVLSLCESPAVSSPTPRHANVPVGSINVTEALLLPSSGQIAPEMYPDYIPARDSVGESIGLGRNSSSSNIGGLIAVILPSILMMLFPLAVLVWLFVLAVSGPRSSARTIRSELRTLGIFSIVGTCFMLWSTIGLMVPLALSKAGAFLPLFFVLGFVFGWLFVFALAVVWIWEAVYARAEARDAAARACSIQSLEHPEETAEEEPFSAGDKGFGRPRLSFEGQRAGAELPPYTLPDFKGGYSPVRTSVSAHP